MVRNFKYQVIYLGLMRTALEDHFLAIRILWRQFFYASVLLLILNVKVDYFDNVMTKFIVINRTDS